MKVVITEVSSPYESILALGVTAHLNSIGISCDSEGAAAAPKPTPPPAIAAPAAAPVKKAAATKKDKVAPAPKAASVDAPRVTIRQRILDLMKKGPVTSADVSRLTGLDIGNSGQHLYLLTKSGLAVRNEDAGTWSLA